VIIDQEQEQTERKDGKERGETEVCTRPVDENCYLPFVIATRILVVLY
jgi:hypothetical protein